jgi:hypothetical protein
MKLEDYLKKHYFQPGSPIFFANPVKLYNHLKKKTYKVTLPYLKEWVKEQEAYSLHKEARHTFPRLPHVLKGKHHLYDADLADMKDLEQENNGYKYILVVIDAYSKFLSVKPLKTKTAVVVKQAIEEIFNVMKKPEVFRTDPGTEFKNKILQQYLNTTGVRHQITTNENKALFAERVIKTLKRKIYHYLTHNNTHTYIDILQKLVAGYNKTVHRSIKIAPKDMTDDKWWDIYKPRGVIKKKPYTIRVGDSVRVSYLSNAFTRAFDQQFSREVFVVTGRYRKRGIPLYKIEDMNGQSIDGTFYSSELQKVNIDKEKMWKVEKVIKTRKRKGVKEYYVKWLGFPDSFNSWVTELESL